MKHGVVFVAGFLFSIGLGVGGMTQPARIIGFLDVTGRWDPTLLFVILGAVATYAVAYAVARRRPRPLVAPGFVLPAPRRVDAPLVVGSALFGTGWGIAGFCPGPGVTALVSLKPQVLAFLGPMLLGIALYEGLPLWLTHRRNRRRAREAVSADPGLVDG